MSGAAAEWSIQDLARTAGTTSRALRHYGERGLLQPSRIGTNGYRYYDQDSLVRLQRILLLRELGLGLAAIAQVLEGERDSATALRTHLRLLEQERDRVHRQIESVRTTLDKTERGERLMAEEMFDGFDHTQYEQEVTDRWGAEAYERGDTWWRSLSDADKTGFQQRQIDIAADYGQALDAGLSADSDRGPGDHRAALRVGGRRLAGSQARCRGLHRARGDVCGGPAVRAELRPSHRGRSGFRARCDEGLRRAQPTNHDCMIVAG